jgi:DNA-directed RNA polymerase II subunit RPB1
MNAHIPQSLQSVAEVSTLSAVPKLVLSAQSSKPVMGIVQDALCGATVLTQRDTFFDRATAMQLLMQLHPLVRQELPPPAMVKPRQLWTGKQLFSLLLPRLDMTSFHSTHPADETTSASPGDSRVLIRDGCLLTGIICKKTIGTSSGGLVHVIARDFGPEGIARFFNGCQRLVNHFLSTVSFSVGVLDCRIPDAARKSINDMLSSSEQSVLRVAKKYQPALETRVSDILTTARDSAGRLAQSHLSRQNNFRRMVSAGSKGNPINISQITACVGQQHVEGKRIPYGFHGRTLPHFAPNDQSAPARGFVRNSYQNGLTPTEFFFHAMGGREGLIDTAVKTAETGYIQRRLIKALEDVSVAYDGTVRNSRGEITQFSYGEDHLDGSCLEKVPVPFIMMGNRELLESFRDFRQGDVERMIAVRDALRRSREMPEEPISCPVPFKRIMTTAARCFPGAPVNAAYVSEQVLAFTRTLPKDARLFGLLTQCLLSVPEVMRRKLSREAFDHVLRTCSSLFAQARVHPGESVGILAAESIGEPATQMTLNTFHVSTQSPFAFDDRKISSS